VDDKPALFLSQNGLIPYLVKAIQEQQDMIDAIRAGAATTEPIPLLADDSSFLDRIVALFSDVLGIDFGQGSSVCVTEEQFMDVFGNGSGSPGTPSPTPEATVEVTPTPTPENGSPDEPFVEPTSEPAPDGAATPSEEPSPEPTP
jgi:hypothetical protein